MSDNENATEDSSYSLDSKREEQVGLPHDNYKLRIKEEPTYGVSKKSGNEYLLFQLEIIEPDVKLVKDAKGVVHETKVSGLEITMPATFFEDKNGKIQNIQLQQIHKSAGFPTTFQRDPDSGLPVDSSGNPFLYAGIELDARCSGKEEAVLNAEGKPLKNPLTGKEKKRFSRQVNEIYTLED